MNEPTATPEFTPAEIIPADVDAHVSAGALLLDVRQPEEFSEAHIDGATLIPLGELADRTAELPTDRTIVCVCRSGGRSGKATDFLRGQGLAVTNMAGGMLRWIAEDRPTV